MNSSTLVRILGISKTQCLLPVICLQNYSPLVFPSSKITSLHQAELVTDLGSHRQLLLPSFLTCNPLVNVTNATPNLTHRHLFPVLLDSLLPVLPLHLSPCTSNMCMYSGVYIDALHAHIHKFYSQLSSQTNHLWYIFLKSKPNYISILLNVSSSIYSVRP